MQQTMQLSLPSTVKVLGLVLAVSFATACAAWPSIAGAQGDVAMEIPVLIMGEDEDPATVLRSSDILKGVIREIRTAMQRHGFRTIGEETLAADPAWKISDRHPKSQLLEMSKAMATSEEASHKVRALVLVRVQLRAQHFGGGVRVSIRIDGEIYDAASSQLVDFYETPRVEFPTSPGCLESRPCITEVVGGPAREIAGDLGYELAIRLARYSPPKSSGGGSGSAHAGAGHGRMTAYTVTLRDFGYVEAAAIIAVMDEEFPGAGSVELMADSPTVKRYSYLTTAKAIKLREWLHILLADMGFDAESDVLVRVQGTDIIVEKLVPTPDRSASPDETKRFK